MQTNLEAELESMMDNTDWEKKYRELHRQVMDYPLEEINKIMAYASQGLSSEEADILKNALISAENLVDKYSSNKIKLPNAIRKVEEIKKTSKKYKKQLKQLVKKTYKNFESVETLRKEQLAKTYISLSELAIQHGKMPWFYAGKTRQIKQYLSLIEKKQMDETAKERSLLQNEISELGKHLKNNDYNAIKNCNYVAPRNYDGPLKKEYEELFEKAKNQLMEYTAITKQEEEKKQKETSLQEQQQKEIYLKTLQAQTEREKIAIEKVEIDRQNFSIPTYISSLGYPVDWNLYEIRSLICSPEPWIERLNKLEQKISSMNHRIGVDGIDYMRQIQWGLSQGMTSGTLAQEIKTYGSQTQAKKTLKLLDDYISKAESALCV